MISLVTLPTVFILLLSNGFTNACSRTCSQCATYTQARVVFTGALNGSIVTFTQSDSQLNIKGFIFGLSEGYHGFHVHEKGDLSNGCASALGHFNPFSKTHGAPDDAERHVGDWGNIFANSSGIANVDINDKLATLNGQYSIIGRAVVVHSQIDDLGRGNDPTSKTTGNAGARVDCAIIGVA